MSRHARTVGDVLSVWSEMLTDLTDRAIARIADYAMRLPAGSGAFEVGQLGARWARTTRWTPPSAFAAQMRRGSAYWMQFIDSIQMSI